METTREPAGQHRFDAAARVIGDLLPLAALGSHPEAGVVDLDGILTPWHDVADSARRVASRLVALGVGPGDRVVVAHPKSPTSFVAVHAIALAGGVMVPLDPMGAPDALALIVRAVEANVIIGAASTLVQRLPAVVDSFDAVIATGDLAVLRDVCRPAATVVGWDEASGTDDHDESSAALPAVEPSDDAYVIFTSGSTGVPKGLLHSHASCLAYAERAVEFHRLLPSSRVAGTSPLHFDMSTLELYAVPLAAATAVTIGEVEQRFPATLSARLRRERVSHLYCVPYQLKQLMQRGDLTSHSWDSVSQIAFGGEAFDPASLVALGASFPTAELLNVYGPAEVNGVVTWSFGTTPGLLEDIPIGRAWQGVTLRVVDSSGRDVEDGEPGELWVDSPSAMRGYWRRPDLDERSFVSSGGRRFYRTGDVVRRLADGTLTYLGREDNRVKVRGVRLELEEVERAVAGVDGIAHVVAVVDRGPLGERIVVWAVADGAPPSLGVVRQACAERLPAAALPQEIWWADSFPATATGKIDRARVSRLRPTPETTTDGTL